MAQFNVDKTVLVVALTRFLNENNIHNYSVPDHIYVGEFQRLLDILTGEKAHLIGERVQLDDWEVDVLEMFMEEV